MLEKFRKFISSEKLFTPGERVLLAVSGGMDSMVLTELFRMAGFRYGIAHCNFQLRGEESDLDEAFVASVAKKNKVPFYSKRFSTLQTASVEGISIQMAARELRYKWFHELVTKEKYNWVATAHHLDDQVETFFINLLRSTGIAGFHGILPKQDKLIRPMLFAGRKEIEAFVRDKKIVYREDRSNSETKYLRNKIRHEILPVFAEINPDFALHLTGNIHRIREAEAIFREAVEEKRKKLLMREKDTIRLPIKEIRKLYPVVTYLFEFLSPFGFNLSQVKDLLKILEKTSGKTILSPTHRMVRDRVNIIIGPREAARSGSETRDHFLIPETASSIREPLKLTFRKQVKDKNFRIDPSCRIAFLDWKKLAFPLHLRRWQHGDIFHPFGRDHRKKLSDYFIDEKFSLFDKENAWVLCSGKDIVWLVGHRIDNRFRITSRTKEVLKIAMKE